MNRTLRAGVAILAVLAAHQCHSAEAVTFQIWTAQDLVNLATEPSDYLDTYVLMADIDMTGVQMQPIGSASRPFRGTFSGQGHTISNLTMTGQYDRALFDRTSAGAIIEDLILESIDISSANNFVGGLISIVTGTTTVRNCGVTGVVSGVDNVGGLIGSQGGNGYSVLVSNCYAICTVTGGDYVGGLVGQTHDHSRIENCYARCNVTGINNVGGLVGRNIYEAFIGSCYAVSTVSGQSRVGGIAGVSTAEDDFVAMEDCFSASTVSGQDQVGPITGYDQFGGSASCFWDFQASGLAQSDPCALDTATLQDWLFYLARGWGDGLWTIDSGHDYPHLALEGVAGRVIPTFSPEEVPLDGSGSSEDPFLLSDANDLLVLTAGGVLLNKCYEMTADINLAGVDFEPIGSAHAPFTGDFNGAGHLITNMTLNGTDYVGLFAKVEGGHISDLGLQNAQVSASGMYVGPLVGMLVDGSVERSYCNARTLGSGDASGFVGYSTGSNISNCYSSGEVTPANGFGAGISVNFIGGLMRNCYSECAIDGSSLAASLTPDPDAALVNCFYFTEYLSDPLVEMAARKVSQQQMQSLFTFQYNRWTDGSWVIDDGNDYPRLTWQHTDGVLILPPDPNGAMLPGSGTEQSPYQIDEPNDLELVSFASYFWEQHLELTADVNMLGLSHVPIGGSEHDPFTGYFDGNGFAIRNLSIQGLNRVGLFRCTALGTIKDLVLDNAQVSSEQYGMYVGAVVGLNVSATIDNCRVTVKVSGDEAGGIAGRNEGLISGCYSKLFCEDGSRVGGIAGGIAGGTITDCQAEVHIQSRIAGGLVSGVGDGSRIIGCRASGDIQSNPAIAIGGLCANGSVNNDPAVVENCYSTVNLTGGDIVGGLIGKVNDNLKLSHCYSIGMVTGDGYVGGAVGRVDGESDIRDCFWDIETSGQTNSAAGLGLTTEQMKNSMLYTVGGWAEQGSWTIDDGDYPRLVWEQMPGEPIPPFAPENLPMAGQGTEQEPFLIADKYDLYLFQMGSLFLDKQMRLTADIDLDGENWRPVASNSQRPFTGTFDGGGHIIHNLTIQGEGYLGLFGYVDSGLITSLGLEDVNVVGTGDNIGAIVGQCHLATISQCYACGHVSGNDNVGGLVGYLWLSEMHNCYCLCDVEGHTQVGGLVGYGLRIGYDFDNCLALGSATGDNYVHPVVGRLDNGELTHSFWSTDTGSLSPYGAIPLDANELANPYILMTQGWGENGAWMIDPEDGRPHLSWEPVAGEPIPAIVSEQSPFSGAGTVEDPFIISDADTLSLLSYGGLFLNYNYALGADIDMADREFYSIGSSATPFYGTFDGRQYTIRNLTMNDHGLFGYVSQATLRNIHLKNATITGTNDKVGGLVGYASDTEITGCRATGTVSGYDMVGGLIGQFYLEGTIDNCQFAGTVAGASMVGGVVGSCRERLFNCSTNCDIHVDEDSGGGICGYNNGYMTDCYSIAHLSGGDYIGGIAGSNFGRIEDCRADCAVEATTYLGGLVGQQFGTARRCSADAVISGVDHIGGLVGYNDGLLEQSSATGSVSGLDILGGLCGSSGLGHITNSYCLVNVLAGEPTAGAVAGFCGSNTGARILNCYCAGTVTMDNPAPGFIGVNRKGYKTSGCFFDYQACGITYDEYAAAMSTSEMLQRQSFLDAGWDFTDESANGVEDVWDICEGLNYPRLAWETPPGDVICPYGVDFKDYAILTSTFADFNGLAVVSQHWLEGVKPPVTVYGSATNPIPSQGTAGIPLSLTLQWTPVENAESHNVYFGTEQPLPLVTNTTEPSFDPGPLQRGRLYFWRIDEVTPDRTVTGLIWSFTTLDGATNPSPPDAATYVHVSTVVQWNAVEGAESYDVYFGTTNPPEFRANTTATTFDPGPLEKMTQYYWRIDTVDTNGPSEGILWTFTTEPEGIGR